MTMGLALALVLPVFQNCGQGFRIADLNSGQNLTGEGSGQFFGEGLSSVVKFTESFADIDPSLKSGTLDENCLTSSADACVFWKNPSATKLLKTGSFMTETAEDDTYASTSLETHQNFAVNVSSIMTGGQLRSSTFSVFHRTGTSTKNFFSGIGGGFRFPLSQGQAATLGGQRFGLEQVQAFFFLDSFEKFMNAKAGTFFATGAGVQVNAVDTTLEGNAYFDPTEGAIELGIRTGKAGRSYPMALSAEVVVHESAHANLHQSNLSLVDAEFDLVVAMPCNASNPYFLTTLQTIVELGDAAFETKVQADCGKLDYDNAETIVYCATTAGCHRAIDEGQADFFSMVYFARAPTVGELSLTEDSIRYWRRRSSVTKSNVTQKMGIQFTNEMNNKAENLPAEIHDMGEIFSEMLFDVYANSKTDRDAFLKTVSESLSRLNGNSTFSTVKDQLISIDGVSFGAKNTPMIRQAFESRGF